MIISLRGESLARRDRERRATHNDVTDTSSLFAVAFSSLTNRSLVARLDSVNLGWATKDFYGWLLDGDLPWYNSTNRKKSPNDARDPNDSDKCMHDQEYGTDLLVGLDSLWERRYETFFDLTNSDDELLYTSFCGNTLGSTRPPGCPMNQLGFSEGRLDFLDGQAAQAYPRGYLGQSGSTYCADGPNNVTCSSKEEGGYRSNVTPCVDDTGGRTKVRPREAELKR